MVASSALTALQIAVAPVAAHATSSFDAGAVTTVAGSGSAVTSAGSASTAGFKTPYGIAVSGGYAYVSDQDAMSKVNLSTGDTTIFSTSPGSGGSAWSETTDGTYIYRLVGNPASVITKTSISTGTVSTVYSDGFNRPMNALAIGSDGYLYATQGNASTGTAQIFRIDPSSGTMAVWFTGFTSEHPYGIVSDGTGLWVVTQADVGGSNRIMHFTVGATTTMTVLVSTDPALGATVTYLGGYLFTSGQTPGNGGSLIRRYSTTDGSVANIAGSGSGYLDGTGADAWFNNIGQITTDGTNLYVVDAGDYHVRQVASASALPTGEQSPVANASPVGLGGVLTVAGSGSSTTSAGSSTAAGFNKPQGVAVIGNYAYVASLDAISKVSLTDGSTTILAGQPSCTGCGALDATTGSSARFGSIADVVSDGHFLYVLDASTVRRVSPTTGATSTIWGPTRSITVHDLTVGPDGSIYLTAGDVGQGTTPEILKFNPATSVGGLYFNTAYLSFLTHNTMNQTPAGIAADSSNLYYVISDGYEGAIVSLPLSGTLTQTALTGSEPLLSDRPHLDLAGAYFYTMGYGTSPAAPDLLLRYPKSGGSSMVVAGGGSGTGTDAIGNQASFAQITGIVSDGSRLFVADSAFGSTADNRLRVVLPVKSASAQGGPTYPGEAGPNTLSEQQTTCQCADPVNTMTGSLTESATDLTIPGRGPAAAFTRTYDSQFAATNGPLGYGWTPGYSAHLAVDKYNGSGALASSPVVDVVQENGSTLPFTRQSNGTYTAPTRVEATLVQNGNGTWTFVRRAQTTLAFNSSGQLTAITDLNGYSTTLGYTSGKLTTVTEPAGRSLTIAYGTNGDIATVTDTAGRQVAYGYDASGNLTSVTDPAGTAWTYGYDASHRLTSVTDPRGHATTSSYDRENRVVSQTDRANRTTTFGYSIPSAAGSDTVTITDPRGIVTTQTYTDGELTAVTNAAGTSVAASWSYSYDSTSNGLTSMTDPLNHVWTYTVDANGNRLTATDPLNHSESSTYNSLNEPLTRTDRDGVTTTYTYDAAGNLLTVSTPLNQTTNSTTTYTYGDATHPGDVTAITDPRGKVSHFVYDTYGQRTSTSDPLGDTTTMSYTCTPSGPGCRSNVGWVYSSVSPRGNVTGGTPSAFTASFTRDDDGRVLTATDQLGHTTTTSYDANGNVAGVTDANNHQTTYTYDNDDERTVTTRADLTTLTDGYDADGNRTTYTDGANHTTTYSYDPLNRLASVTDALSRTITYGYDAAGNLTTVVNPSNSTTTYGYDAANRRTTVAYSDGTTPNVTYGYDNVGRRTSMSDGSGNSSYSYDALGRLTGHTDGAGHVVGYGYDLDGNVTTLTYPNSKTVTRGYDDADRLTSVTDWNNNTHTFSYDADGDLTGAAVPNGVTESTTLNNSDQITAMADTTGVAPNVTTLAGYTYTRDSIGLLTGTTPTGTTGQTNETYGHSTLDQITGYTTTSRSGTYGYDHGDNLTGLADGTSQTFDAADQVATAGGVTFGYNSQGDRTSATATASTTTYGYDQADRLTSYSTTTGTNATYAYDGDGLRTTKTVGTTTTSFAWDGVTGRTPLLLSDGSTSYLYGPDDEVIEQIAASAPTISLVATGSGIDSTGTAASVSATFSHAAAANDQILVAVNATAGQNPAAPAGYTTVGTFAAPSAGEVTTVYRATATGGETGVTVTFNQGTNVHAKTVLVAIYRGVDPVEPLDPATPAANGTSTATATTVSVGGITTTHANDQLVLIADGANNVLTASWTPPTGMTSQVTNGAATVASMIADQALTTAGATGTRAPTISQPAQLETVLLALRPAPDTYYYGHDQQDSTRLLTGPDATVYATYSYDPYGRTTSHTGPINTALLYDGQYQDNASGLYYLRARYYDPTTAQFLTRDPLENETGQPYAYAADDPTDNGDPSGMSCNANPLSLSFWSSGNCLSENTPSWVPVAGQVKSFASCAGAGDMSVYDCAVTNLDPAYLAIDGYYNEWEDSEHGCSLSTIFGDGLEAVSGVAGTAGIAVGGASYLDTANLARVGPAYSGGPFRVSLGAQQKYWQQFPPWRQLLQPFHLHMERARGGLTYNPTGRSWRLWGNWK